MTAPVLVSAAATPPPAPPPALAPARADLGLLAVWGPGLIVMLADTDAGCLITAAQSGAQWGYAMVRPSWC